MEIGNETDFSATDRKIGASQYPAHCPSAQRQSYFPYARLSRMDLTPIDIRIVQNKVAYRAPITYQGLLSIFRMVGRLCLIAL